MQKNVVRARIVKRHKIRVPVLSLVAVIAVFTAMLALVFQAANAAEVINPYRAEIEVRSQQARERQAAISAGLGQVITRVTGRRDVIEQPQIRQALGQAEDRYLVEFGYIDIQTRDAQGNLSPGQALRLDYDPGLVNQLLRGQGLPIWGGNRPSLLVWLTVEDESGRWVVSADRGREIVARLRSVSKARGVPVLFPLMDLQDETSISRSESWGLFRSALEMAAERYMPEAVLAGNVYLDSDGRWRGRWLFIFNNESVSTETEAASLAEFPIAAMHEAADRLGRFYAVNTGEGLSQRFQISVGGINGLTDYAAVTSYLGKMAQVRSVTVIEVRGSQLLIELQTDGPVEKLQQILLLDNRLSATAAAGRVTATDYLWRP